MVVLDLVVLHKTICMSILDSIALHQSLRLISSIKGVEVTGDWKEPITNIWTLPLCLELIKAESTPYIPFKTNWVVVIDFEKDVWGKTLLYPAADKETVVATFPHQMFNGYRHDNLASCRSGNLCTSSAFDNIAANRNAIPAEPQSTIERIVWHVNRALEWLSSAASDRLSIQGSPYELPDYNFGKHATLGALAYYEDEKSLTTWQETAATSGVVELAVIGNTNNFVTKRFLDRKGETVYTPEWGNRVSKHQKTIPALWLMLPKIPVVNNWQAPSTIAELQEACKDFNTILDPLWNRLGDANPALLLIGAPVPKTVGGDLSHIHWQALFVSDGPKPQNRKTWPGLVKNHMAMGKRHISWFSRSENWHPKELQSRGRLSNNLCDANVLLLGAGALGSCLAEQLTRMGVKKMTIVDADRLEAGNLVRHTLTIDNLYELKAEAIAKRLNNSNPSADISFINAQIPDHTNNKDIQTAVTNADIIIDATADDEVLKAMPLSSVRSGIPVVSCSLSIESAHLYFFAHQSDKINWQMFDEWYAPFRLQQDALVNQMDLPRGLGCWHPLIPARLNRIQSLSGIAVELIEQLYDDNDFLPAKEVITWSIPVLKR